jgi:hypothetical protein
VKRESSGEVKGNLFQAAESLVLLRSEQGLGMEGAKFLFSKCALPNFRKVILIDFDEVQCTGETLPPCMCLSCVTRMPNSMKTSNSNQLNLLIPQLLAQLEYADYQRAVWGVLNKVPLEQAQEGPIWRQVQFLSVIGPAALPPELLDRVSCVFMTFCLCDLLRRYSDEFLTSEGRYASITSHNKVKQEIISPAAFSAADISTGGFSAVAALWGTLKITVCQTGHALKHYGGTNVNQFDCRMGSQKVPERWQCTLMAGRTATLT